MEWRPVLCHGQEWTGVCSDIRKEIPDIIHESNEALDIIVVLGNVPLSDMGHLVSVDVDFFLVDYMTKAVDFVGIQVAFDPFEEELMLPQSFKHEAKMLFVLFYGV